MEAFKAVEKEMKTKAFSKEGLSLAAKLDPKDQEKEEMLTFVQEEIEKLGEQVEQHEASISDLKAKSKKGKKGALNENASRIEALEHACENNKWHQGRLELLLRGVDNGSIDSSSIKGEIQEQIQEYVEQNQEPDFDPDQYGWIYDDFNLDEGEKMWGMPAEPDKTTSHEDHSSVGEPLEQTISNEDHKDNKKQKGKVSVDNVTAPHRRPSQQIKSPLPTLATLHTIPQPSPSLANKDMKPAPPPKPVGEPRGYASAAAAATATDKAGIGIAPLPAANIGASLSQTTSNSGLAPQQPDASAISSVATSPAATTAAPTESRPSASISASERGAAATKSPVASHSSTSGQSPAALSAQLGDAMSPSSAPVQNTAPSRPPGLPATDHEREPLTDATHTNGISQEPEEPEEEESIYHLPESLKELVSTYEAAVNQSANLDPNGPEMQRLLQQSYMTRPDANDAQPPQHYRPAQLAAYTPPHYPQEPSPIFNNPRLYERIDTDSLFYSFYYRQGTYQQYLAAKALKANSWRFHKQYQTWFQRHEEPKNITEDYEQGTYRFFDYESTW